MDTERNRKIKEEIGERMVSYLRQREQQAPLKMREGAKDEVWKRIVSAKPQQKHRTIGRSWFVAAASVAAVVLFAILFYTPEEMQKAVMHDRTDYQHMTSSLTEGDEIELLISGNEQIVVDASEKKIVHSSDGIVRVGDKQLHANSTSNINGRSEMNQLWVPYGKHIQLVLSDGSVLDVNAGSRVIYPKEFHPGCREIYVEGEIYIDVRHNDNVPFVVRTNNFDVNVLGTAFNIMAYKDEAHSEVVLVRGKVEVKDRKEQSYLMSPNEKVRFDNDNYAGKEKVNGMDYVAWKEGLLILQGESLTTVLQKLVKYYNRKIEFDPALLAQISMHGKIDVNESLENVLTSIALTSGVQWEKIGTDYHVLKQN